MSVKIRHIKNSYTLEIPSDIKPIASEFNVFQDHNGIIIYKPVHKNTSQNDTLFKTHNLRPKKH